MKIGTDKLYSIRNYFETFLWVLIFVIGFIGLYKQNNNLLRITAYLLIFLGIYWIITSIYFKKSPVLRGVSDKSKIAIVGTLVLTALLFYAAYYILAHFA